MQHFIVEIIYKADISVIDKLRPAHREFLDEGYKKGIILMSGPQVPRTGGIIIAREESMEKLAEFLNDDPYQVNKAADYQYIQFDPRNHQNFLKEWVEG